MGNVPVNSVVPEKLGLRLQRVTHTLLCHDILLTPVHYANKAQFERINASCENVECVRPSVHEVQL